MRKLLFALSLAITPALSAAAAPEAEWWLVTRPPGAPSVLFVDTATVAEQGDGSIELRVMTIDRLGRSSPSIKRVDCGRTPDRNVDVALQRFACAPAADRDRRGLMLAGMSPAEAARVMFGIERDPVAAESAVGGL